MMNFDLDKDLLAAIGSVVEGWGAEGANRKHADMLAKREALHAKFKDDPEMLAALKKQAANGVHPDYAEVEARKLIKK